MFYSTILLENIHKILFNIIIVDIGSIFTRWGDPLGSNSSHLLLKFIIIKPWHNNFSDILTVLYFPHALLFEHPVDFFCLGQVAGASWVHVLPIDSVEVVNTIESLYELGGFHRIAPKVHLHQHLALWQWLDNLELAHNFIVGEQKSL